jgi:hypothetical protein
MSEGHPMSTKGRGVVFPPEDPPLAENFYYYLLLTKKLFNVFKIMAKSKIIERFLR